MAVTAATQVTTNPNPIRAHSSPVLARNPKNGELTIVETDVYGGFGVNVHLSRDDGRRWFKGGDPMMKPYTWNSDLAINGPYFTSAYDDDGLLFVALSATDPKHAGVNRSERPRPIFLARSTDSGRTFTTTFVYQPTEGNAKTVNNRRPMLAFHPGDSTSIYVSWIQTSAGEKARSMIAGSSDGGRTFRPPVDLAEAEPQGGYQPRAAVTPDGKVHAVYPGAGFTPPAAAGQPAPEMPIRPISYRNSGDGARTWSPPVIIDQGNQGFFFGRKQLMAADPNNGNLYVTWAGNANPKAGPSDENDIFLRSSTDGGRTWSDRVVVNDDASKPAIQHYDPGISIAPNGRVDLAWYDFRNSPVPELLPTVFAAPFNTGGFTDVYYASSTDGGKTFGPNVLITDRIIDRRIGVWSNNVHSHYNMAIASTNSQVYFAWQDSRNGSSLTNSEDIYAATLLLDGAQAVDQDSGSDVPGWVVFGAAGAVGMGLAMVAVFLVSRRSRPEPAKAVASRS